MSGRATPKPRLDQLLVERTLASSREEARGMILAGNVLVGDHRVDKPGTRVDPDAPLRVKGEPRRYASRAGSKLEGALEAFGVDPSGRKALDCGISTGGFTDCLLRRNAAHVVGVDVGYGQVVVRLRSDPRVTLLERTNLRALDPASLPYAPDLVTLDVSFISLELVLPAVVRLLAPVADVVALVKPQFEVGRGRVGKGGIVTSPDLHRAAIERVVAAARDLGLAVRGVTRSHPAGADGNREFFVHLARPGDDLPVDLAAVVGPLSEAP